MDNFKRIRIHSRGVIEPKGFIIGPILTPYKEKLDVIFQLITANYNVVEVLDDGTEVILTATNYDKDNSLAGRKEELEEEAKVEESTVDTITVENTTDNDNPKSYHINKNGKKNKNKNFSPDKMESI